jgi:glucan phosphorylase
MSHVGDDLPVSAAALRESIQRHARYSLAQAWGTLSPYQRFECVGLAVRDLLVDRLLETGERHRQADAKHVSYLSIEYLLGRCLTNNLVDLGIYELCRDRLGSIGVDHGDVYFHLADLPAYIETQDRVGGEFGHPAAWASKAILNVARSGRFSSDRTVSEYARDIWRVDRIGG